MAAPAVRRNRYDAVRGMGLFHAPSHPQPGLFSWAGKEWAELVRDPFSISIYS